MITSFNYKIVLKVISRNLFILGSGLLFCDILAFFYSESLKPFTIAATVVLGIGFVLFSISKKQSEDIVVQNKEAYLTVFFSWLTISLFGSLPYILSGAIPNFVDALFESVSGFTTTGASILSEIESLPHSILFWRSLTHWIGGIGIIVLVIIIMPALKISGYHLFSLESSLQEKIRPKIKSVGRRLLIIYLSLTIAEVILLKFGGMNCFDSFCHAFGTIATGGFSTKNDSLVSVSPYIQYVVMIFMLLAGTNFIIFYYLFNKDYSKVKKNEEFWFYIKTVLTLGIILTISLYLINPESIEFSFREAFFQLISIVTCTGFTTSDYLLWPPYAYGLIFIAMFLGGSTGSTAGGIKMARHLLLIKNFKRIIRTHTSPKAAIPIKLNDNVIHDDANMSFMSFLSFYILIFIIGSIALMIFQVDTTTAASSVATCMAGIGPGLGKVGPMNNFSHLSPIVKIILSFIMLVGRLEIYAVLILFSPSFWKK